MPCAARAMKLAVAGAMQNNSARAASSIWAPSGKRGVERIDRHGPGRERGERGPANELFGRRRHHDGDSGAGLHKLADKRGCLVGGDTARHAHDDFAALASKVRGVAIGFFAAIGRWGVHGDRSEI